MRPVILLVVLASLGVAADGNLVPEGAFHPLGGSPAGWTAAEPTFAWMIDRWRVRQEDGVTFIRATQPPADIAIVKPVPAGARAVTLAARVRRTGIVAGANPWEAPYLELVFIDRAGKELGDWQRASWLAGDTTGWEDFRREYPVIDGAVTMRVVIGLKAVGTFDVADLRLTPGQAGP